MKNMAMKFAIKPMLNSKCTVLIGSRSEHDVINALPALGPERSTFLCADGRKATCPESLFEELDLAEHQGGRHAVIAPAPPARARRLNVG